MRFLLIAILLMSGCDYGEQCADSPPAGECWIWRMYGEFEEYKVGICCDGGCNCSRVFVDEDGSIQLDSDVEHGCVRGAVRVNDHKVFICSDSCDCEIITYPSWMPPFPTK